MEIFLTQIREKEEKINDVTMELQRLDQQHQSSNTDEELQKFKNQCESKLREYRHILNEKSVMYDEMFSMAKQLIHRDQLIIKNQEEIVAIKYDIDISKLELEQKKEMVQELESRLE